MIGVLRVTLHLPESGSLKAKRQVVAGLLRRVRTRFGVSAAEVGDRERWQLAHLAVACVSPDGRQADQMLAHVLRFLEAESVEAQITDVSTELLRI